MGALLLHPACGATSYARVASFSVPDKVLHGVVMCADVSYCSALLFPDGTLIRRWVLWLCTLRALRVLLASGSLYFRRSASLYGCAKGSGRQSHIDIFAPASLGDCWLYGFSGDLRGWPLLLVVLLDGRHEQRLRN